jgi:hypothetical protein
MRSRSAGLSILATSPRTRRRAGCASACPTWSGSASGNPSAPQSALSFRFVNFCAKCREELKAFIRKPENGDPDDVSPAVRVARALTVVCIWCGTLIAPAAAAKAETPAAGYSVSHPLTAISPFPAPSPPIPGDHQPPHREGPELTRDGSAATYAVTAPTARALAVPPPRWSAEALGLPGHAVLPQYPPQGPHAAPTHRVAPPPYPGPFRPPAGPGLAQQ